MANHVTFTGPPVQLIADRAAVGRLEEYFTAELVSETFEKEPELDDALEVKNAYFTWDSPPPDEGNEQFFSSCPNPNVSPLQFHDLQVLDTALRKYLVRRQRRRS